MHVFFLPLRVRSSILHLRATRHTVLPGNCLDARRCSYLSTNWDTDIGIWSILAWLPSSAVFFVCRHFHSQTDAGMCVPP